LAKEVYKGRILLALTLCIKNRVKTFIDPQVVNIFTKTLEEVAARSNCTIPVYCFMPDHLHLILSGNDDEVDLLKVINAYKQKTGFWLSRNRKGILWQKDFYDHVIRKEEGLTACIKYILDNPVRKGIVAEWQEYPFKGSVGYDLEEVLSSLI